MPSTSGGDTAQAPCACPAYAAISELAFDLRLSARMSYDDPVRDAIEYALATVFATLETYMEKHR